MWPFGGSVDTAEQRGEIDYFVVSLHLCTLFQEGNQVPPLQNN